MRFFLILLWGLIGHSRAENESRIVGKVVDIFNDYYEEKYTQSSVVVITDGTKDDVGDEIIRSIHQTGRCKVATMKFRPGCEVHSKFQIGFIPSIGHINLMVIIENSLEVLDNILGCFKITTVGRLPRRIIVVATEVKYEEIRRMFETVWLRKVLNLVVITTNLSGQVDIVGFNPYFGNYFENVTHLPLFPDKLKNLNGHPLRLFFCRPEDLSKVSGFKVGNKTRYTGQDGMAIQTILEKINATFEVTNIQAIFGVENPWRWANRNLKEHLKDQVITKYKPDFFFDSLEMEYNNHTDLIYPHTANDGVILIPKAGYKSLNRVLYRVFQQGFFLIVIFFIIACPIVWFGLITIEQVVTRRNFPKLSKIFNLLIFNNIQAFLGISFCIPRINFIHNYFLLWLLLCSLIVNNYFQSILKSLLTVSERDSDLDSIKDLTESTVTPYAPAPLIQDITSILKEGGSKYVPRFEVLPPNFYDINFKKVPRNVSVLAERNRLEILVAICPMFHIMKETIKPLLNCYHVFKGAPYYEVFEEYVPKMLEAGLFEFWKRQNHHKIYLAVGLCDIYVDVDVENDGRFKVLSIEKMRIAFYGLFVGWILAFIVFILEHLIKIKTYFN